MAVDVASGEVRVLRGKLRLGCCYHGATGGTLRWSPDGSLIGEVSGTEQGEAVVRLDGADGSGQAEIYPGVAFDWKPDGSKIVVATANAPVPGAPAGYVTSSLYVIDRVTGHRVWIADGDYPDWTP